MGRERRAGVHQTIPLPAHALLERRERQQVQEGLLLQVPGCVGAPAGCAGAPAGLPGSHWADASASSSNPLPKLGEAPHSSCRLWGDHDLQGTLSFQLEAIIGSCDLGLVSSYPEPLGPVVGADACVPVGGQRAARRLRAPSACQREGSGPGLCLSAAWPVTRFLRRLRGRSALRWDGSQPGPSLSPSWVPQGRRLRFKALTWPQPLLPEQARVWLLQSAGQRACAGVARTGCLLSALSGRGMDFHKPHVQNQNTAGDRRGRVCWGSPPFSLSPPCPHIPRGSHRARRRLAPRCDWPPGHAHCTEAAPQILPVWGCPDGRSTVRNMHAFPEGLLC